MTGRMPTARRTRLTRTALVAASVLAAPVLAVSACGAATGPSGSAASGTGASDSSAGSSGSGSSGSGPSGSATAGATRTLTVFAAASLRQTFTRLGAEYEKSLPGSTVSFSFAGSSDLVAQLEQGAPADVLATADERTMTKALGARLLGAEPRPFATNTLTIVTPPDNPRQVTRLADLARDGVSVVVCAPPVPCGAATERVERSSGVTLKPVSEEQSVTDVLGKVRAGQADAGIVYATDARSAGSAVRVIPLPEASAAVNTYPIAVTATARGADAQAFVDLVTGPQGRAVLTEAGFQKP